MRVLGLISGTSADGVDAAVAELALDGEEVVLAPVGHRSTPYAPEVLRRLLAAMPPHAVTAGDVCALDTLIGQAFAEAAAAMIERHGPVALVASHGQTLYHWVDGPRALGTLQLGQPAWIAERTGVPVVADLRARDVAAGGHGAPLVAMLDVLALAGGSGTRAALNLGGIANVTIVPPTGEPLAYDTGPANALIDAVVAEVTGGRETCDRDGRRAAAGSVDRALLDRLLADPYYRLPPPKSTGKEHFHRAYLEQHVGGREITADDLVATVTALTVETVAAALERHDARDVVVAGGGVANPTLMRGLRTRLPGSRLRPFDELGLPAAGKEAYAFALLGFLTAHGLPGTVPSCTGARHPTILGAIVPGGTPAPGWPRPPGAARPRRLRIAP